ncbi:hydrogenase maturation nickel metallochaperone HypA [Desulfohalobium retbaense]|uniref:Hydrogenase maturation factor HypA n=1 Tax=Desulfohalobium retbaense (strain ATCC 49708 / DSM 5692 / JCM 16813 / HR100) TaxID=485915 RepID=C8X0C1_DESRD|nr:hydrogenase maturation nickel metallochaperone HypA [Desulfohalobium retbaense]ACV67746.1 hydrogenase expression/synthesis HypA [Desulfohalobium retbaense DSM 5692]
MHEMSIAQSLVEILQDEMTKHGVSRLKRVKVKHGRLAAVVPEALDMAFQALTVETDMAGATLELEEVPVQVRCSACGAEFAPEEASTLYLPCPQCEEPFGHEILSGKELYIDELEAE